MAIIYYNKERTKKITSRDNPCYITREKVYKIAIKLGLDSLIEVQPNGSVTDMSDSLIKRKAA